METLKSEKFAKLSTEEMTFVNGGEYHWGWVVEEVLCFPNGTKALSQRYNIFGNPVGDPVSLDD